MTWNCRRLSVTRRAIAWLDCIRNGPRLVSVSRLLLLFNTVFVVSGVRWWAGGIAVRVSDLQPTGRRFESRPLHFT